MTLHQINTHPEPVEGCFGCKVASVQFVGCFPTRSRGAGRSDAIAQKRWDKELDRYAEVRKQGIQPDGTTMPKIVAAEEKSDRLGVAYGTDAYQAETTKKVIEKLAD